MLVDILENKIIQMAVQGNLVRQDPSDETVYVLLKKIHNAGENLLGNKYSYSTIYHDNDGNYYEEKSDETESHIIQVPFNIPETWAWVKLGQLVQFKLGKTPKREVKDFWTERGYPWFTIADMRDKHEIKRAKESITGKAVERAPMGEISPKGTLLMSFKLSIGKTSILGVDAYHNEAIISIFPFYDEQCVVRDFLLHVLGKMTEYVNHTQAIKGQTLNSKKLNELLIPLPPLSEQKRIIGKLESIYNQIDLIEKKKSELAENETIIEEKILKMAIQGKLIPQNPNDEPGSILIEKIAVEKARLIKNGVIKKRGDSSIIYKNDKDNCWYEKTNGISKDISEEIPFVIPQTWGWVRFQDLVKYKLGRTPERKNESNWDGEVPWFSISDLKNGEVVINTKEKISQSALTKCFNNEMSPEGTLVMSFKLTIGRTSILGVDAVHNEAIISIFPYLSDGNVIRDYLLKILGVMVTYVNETTAVKGATLNSKKLDSMLIPLPPLAEQKRIVKEVEKYEALLERLKKI